MYIIIIYIIYNYIYIYIYIILHSTHFYKFTFFELCIVLMVSLDVFFLLKLPSHIIITQCAMTVR